jgi:site-specific DNA-methyltransferase (adenine-specific)
LRIELIHGDCIEKMSGIADQSIDMVMTDPPYGTTACKWDSIIPLEPMWQQLKRIIKPNGAIVMTASQPFTTTLIASNMGMLRYCWVWEKTRASNPYLAKCQPLRAHEDVVVFGVGSPMYYPQKTSGDGYTISRKAGGRVAGDKITNNPSYEGKRQSGRYPRTVQKISNSSAEVGMHPTQKPVALMEYLIKTYTNEGETVLDFAMGSGTTGVACVNLNRDFIGIEKDAEYFDIARGRVDACRKTA